MAFDGTWKVDRNENYEKFMEKMGINVVKRKLAAHDNLKLTITQEGNKFTVKESSTFRSIDIIFELGVTFNYSLADGTELTGAWSQEGNKLVGKFKRVDNGNELTTVREIIGGEMVQIRISENRTRDFRKLSSDSDTADSISSSEKPEQPVSHRDAAGRSYRAASRASPASGWRRRRLPAVTETADRPAALARWERRAQGPFPGRELRMRVGSEFVHSLAR
ncbi:fatty acid-binding protein, intestinal [Hippopotamus amphibius kiboko]|uniref:fatty acid-binding protein, intestinal n=1 Tax=Hippopotamus amphibius kiboko TaxID=575201 RepID=UPI002593A19D|nr:fatty acid-binding protein, intestinal [Hippopotamus amphibius kiboko]